MTVRRNSVILGLAGALCVWAGVVTAGDKPSDRADIGAAIMLQMQTAFNPNLPGSGEAVRTFTKTLKHMSAGALSVRIVEPGRLAPTRDMLDAIISGDLEAAFTWTGYAATKAPVFGLFGSLPFGPGPEEMASWILEGDGRQIHRAAYDKLGVTGVPCGVQGPKGGGWFRTELNTVADFKDVRLRYGRLSGEVITRMGATLVPLPAGGGRVSALEVDAELLRALEIGRGGGIVLVVGGKDTELVIVARLIRLGRARVRDQHLQRRLQPRDRAARRLALQHLDVEAQRGGDVLVVLGLRRGLGLRLPDDHARFRQPRRDQEPRDGADPGIGPHRHFLRRRRQGPRGQAGADDRRARAARASIAPARGDAAETGDR